MQGESVPCDCRCKLYQFHAEHLNTTYSPTWPTMEVLNKPLEIPPSSSALVHKQHHTSSEQRQYLETSALIHAADHCHVPSGHTLYPQAWTSRVVNHGGHWCVVHRGLVPWDVLDLYFRSNLQHRGGAANALHGGTTLMRSIGRPTTRG
jgi:hypothetical protein